MKKTVAIFLILALVMSFFVACDSDSGSGSAEGFFPVVKKVPTTEEKNKVNSISGEAINYAVIAIAAVEEVPEGTNAEKINTLFEYYGIGMICDGDKQTVVVNSEKETINVDVSLKTLTGDIHFSVEGIVFGKGENIYDFAFNLTFKMGTDISLNASGSAVFAFGDTAPLIKISKAEYTKVVLDDVEYIASDFDYTVRNIL